MNFAIDLGTTHSLIAYWESQKAHLIPNSLGENMTPSIVGIDDQGNLIVGKGAQTLPDAVRHFKRHMGSKKGYTLAGKTFQPEELSALVIKSLLEDAKAHLGVNVEEVVISVPAYFNDIQRKATYLAGELAGVKVRRLINEPTAAALAYGLHQEALETKFLIFDLGGGTFDVSVVELFAGIMEVCSSAGDNFLGGQDFSDVLEEVLKEKLIDQVGNEGIPSNLSQMIDPLKHRLSQAPKAPFQLEGSEVTFEVTQEVFETHSAPLIERLQTPIAIALNDAKLKPSELDKVILVGGATRMPMIQEKVAKLFGQFPQHHLNPDEVVAKGAAIQAALIAKHQDLKDLVMTDVCPFTLGTSTQEGDHGGNCFLPIIERNTTIPASRSVSLCTVSHNQRRMKIDVYQGESYFLEDNIKIGEFAVSIPSKPAGEEKVEVRYSYDVNGLLEVEAKVVSTGKKRSLLIHNQSPLTEEQINASCEKLKNLKIHPRNLTENRTLLSQLATQFTFLKGEEREACREIMQYFNKTLSSQDLARIKEAQEMVQSFLAEDLED